MKLFYGLLLSLMIAFPVFADPEDAVYPTYNFTIDTGQYSIGLYDAEDPYYPDIVYPALWSKQDGVWYEIDTYQPLLIDVQEDFTPEYIASSIIKKFNITLASHGGTPMSWNQKLAAIFQLRLSVANNQLVIKP